MNNRQKAKTKSEGIEGKNYSIIYDYDGNLVKYWPASHRIDKISNKAKTDKKKKIF